MMDCVMHGSKSRLNLFPYLLLHSLHDSLHPLCPNNYIVCYVKLQLVGFWLFYLSRSVIFSRWWVSQYSKSSKHSTEMGIEEDDEKLRELRAERAFEIVVKALMDLDEYNPSGRHDIPFNKTLGRAI